MTAILSGHHYGALKMWPAVPESVGDARRCLTGYLAEHGLVRLTDAAELVLSELVTNSVVHANSPFGHLIATRFELLPSGVRIEVHDASDVKPEFRTVSADAECGRGLALVDALTGGQWGVSDRQGPGKCVWAQIEVGDADGTGAKPRRVPTGRRRYASLQAASELVATLIDVLTGGRLLRARFARLTYDVHIESDPRDMPEEDVSALLRSLAQKFTVSADGSVDFVLAVGA